MVNFGNSDYWNKYSEKEDDFEQEVRRGIWFRCAGKSALPEPPEGYSWVLESSGSVLTTKATYRLWTPKLGYMPGSE